MGCGGLRRFVGFSGFRALRFWGLGVSGPPDSDDLCLGLCGLRVSDAEHIWDLGFKALGGLGVSA